MKRLLKIIDSIDPVKKTKENPFFKSMYFDINELLKVLKPIFKAEGLVLSQPLTHIEGRPALATNVFELATGNIIYNEIITLPDLQDPQKMGASITYYRRHALKSLLCLEEVDADGAVPTPKDVAKANAPKTTETKTSVIDLIGKVKNTKTKAKLLEWKKFVANSSLTAPQKNVLNRAIEEQEKTLKS